MGESTKKASGVGLVQAGHSWGLNPGGISGPLCPASHAHSYGERESSGKKGQGLEVRRHWRAQNCLQVPEAQVGEQRVPIGAATFVRSRNGQWTGTQEVRGWAKSLLGGESLVI